MILTGTILFLLGAAVSAEIPTKPAEIIIEKHVSPSENFELEYMPSSGHSPFISNFIQKGTNIFFKPQFMLSSSQLPPKIQNVIAAIEKNCKVPIPMMASLSNIEEPLRVIEKEINESPIKKIKEIIEINPAKFAVKAHEIWEEEVATRKPVEVIEHIKIPEAPVLLPYVPDVAAAPRPAVIEITKPTFIPSPPELPPFTPPKLPVKVEISSKLPESSEPKFPVLIEMEEPKEITKSIVIPPAPKLPHLDLPSLPLILKKPSPAPHLTVVELEKHIEIPTAPELPSFELPKLSNPIIVEEIKPVSIPQPPVLPPFELPQLPARLVIEESLGHKSPVVPVPCEPSSTIEINTKPLPDAPILPPFHPMKLPAPVLIEEHISEKAEIKPLVIPSAPVLPPFKMPEVSVSLKESEKEPPCPQNTVIIDPRPVLVPVEMLSIPARPMFPEWLMPYIPQLNHNEEKNIYENITPSLTSCIHDIVVDRILSKNSLELFPTSSRVPVSFAYLPPVPTRMA